MQKKKHTIYFFLLFLILSGSLYAQEADTTKPKKNYKAQTAAIMSACMPGLGQIYNKKYWKLPIIYGGFAGLYYLLNSNISEYKKYKTAYRFALGDSTALITPDIQNILHKYNTPTILEAKTSYKNSADFFKLISVLLYALNIVDASVDASLKDFEVNDKLTLSLQPAVTNYYTGLSIKLNIK